MDATVSSMRRPRIGRSSCSTPQCVSRSGNASAATAGTTTIRRGVSLNSANFFPSASTPQLMSQPPTPSLQPLSLPPLGIGRAGSAQRRRHLMNMAPQCRIDQNFLLFHNTGGPVCQVVSIEKFINHTRNSPSPLPPQQQHSRESDALVGSSARPSMSTKTAKSPSLPVESSSDHPPPDGGRRTTRRPAAPQHQSSLPASHNHSTPSSPTVELAKPEANDDNALSEAEATTLIVDEMPMTTTTRDDDTVMRGETDKSALEGGGVEHVLITDDLPHRYQRGGGGGNTVVSVARQYDPDDVEAKMPAEKSSLKSSLKVEDTILRLNIGGASYRIRTRSILKYGPATLLGRFCRMDHEHRRSWADAFFDETDEYFFERVPRYFDPIYDFYAAGKLHVPKDLCFEKFMAELRFWAVSKAKMDDCCSPFAQYCLMRKLPIDQPEKDHFIGLRCAKVRRRLWLILEGHSHSKWWKLFEITSTSFVVLSITALILGSIPEFQVPEYPRGSYLSIGTVTYPTYPKVEGYTVSTTTVVKDGDEARQEMVEHPVFNIVENVCVVYFTVEYLLRFWVAPRKLAFVKEFLNIIDLLAIAPFVFEIILVLVGIRGDNVRKVRWAFLTVRLLRVLRVVRIAKLGRFSPGLANFALTLRKSKKQMQMVAIVLLTVIIFFSTLVYFLERDEPNTTFTSIPAAFWWCLFSQTKWVPQTAIGKVVGGGAIICGVLVLALPIAILVNNFMQVVKLREEKVIKQYAQQHGDHV